MGMVHSDLLGDSVCGRSLLRDSLNAKKEVFHGVCPLRCGLGGWLYYWLQAGWTVSVIKAKKKKGGVPWRYHWLFFRSFLFSPVFSFSRLLTAHLRRKRRTGLRPSFMVG